MTQPNKTMTNEQAAEQYRLAHHSQADNDFQNAMNIAVWKAYVAGCEWKDEQHKQEKQQLIEKACKVHCAKFCKIHDRTQCQVCNSLNLIKKAIEE